MKSIDDKDKYVLKEPENAQKQLKEFEKFPSENPNAILRFDSELYLVHDNLARIVLYTDEKKTQ